LRRSDDSIDSRCYSGRHKTTQEEDDRETLGKEIWIWEIWEMWTADFRFSWRKMEMQH